MRATSHGSGRESGRRQGLDRTRSYAGKQNHANFLHGKHLQRCSNPKLAPQKRQVAHPAAHRLRRRERRRGCGGRVECARGGRARARLRQRLLPLGARLAGLRAAEDSNCQHSAVLQRTSSVSRAIFFCQHCRVHFYRLQSAAQHYCGPRAAVSIAECFFISALSLSQN